MRLPPEMRGAWVTQALDAVDKLPREQSVKIRATLPQGLAGKIACARSTDWLPAEWLVALADAVYQNLSREEADRVWLQKAIATFKGPLLEPSLEHAFSILEVSADTVLRWAVKPSVGVGLVFRNCGTLELESIAADSAVLLHRDLPALLFDSDPWCESTRGTFTGILSVGNAELTRFAFERSTTADKRDLRYRLGWRAAR